MIRWNLAFRGYSQSFNEVRIYSRYIFYNDNLAGIDLQCRLNSSAEVPPVHIFRICDELMRRRFTELGIAWALLGSKWISHAFNSFSIVNVLSYSVFSSG